MVNGWLVGIVRQTFMPKLQVPERKLLELLLVNAYSHTSIHGAYWQDVFTRMTQLYDCDSSHGDCSTCESTPTDDLLRTGGEG